MTRGGVGLDYNNSGGVTSSTDRGSRGTRSGHGRVVGVVEGHLVGQVTVGREEVSQGVIVAVNRLASVRVRVLMRLIEESLC